MTNAVVLPLYFISGVFVPVSELPDGARHVAGLPPGQALRRRAVRRLRPAHDGRRARRRRSRGAGGLGAGGPAARRAVLSSGRRAGPRADHSKNWGATPVRRRSRAVASRRACAGDPVNSVGPPASRPSPPRSCFPRAPSPGPSPSTCTARARSSRRPRAQLMNCAVGPAGKSEATVTDCVAGTPGGLYNSFDVVNLQASVPQDSFDRGWRFLKYVDSGAGGGQINCDPQGTTGDHFSVDCQFQIFENLETNLYFDDIAGPSDTTILTGPPLHTNATTASLTSTLPAILTRRMSAASTGPASAAGTFAACGSPSDKAESYSRSDGERPLLVLRPRQGSEWQRRQHSVAAVERRHRAARAVDQRGSCAGLHRVLDDRELHRRHERGHALLPRSTPSRRACSPGPGTYTGLSNGPHTLTLTATDAAGNSAPVVALVDRRHAARRRSPTRSATPSATVSPRRVPGTSRRPARATRTRSAPPPDRRSSSTSSARRAAR